MTRKLRGFVVDESTGAPLPHVPFALVGTTSEPSHDAPAPVDRTLAVFRSDHAGFFSVPLITTTGADSFAIYPLGDVAKRMDVTKEIELEGPASIVPVTLPGGSHAVQPGAKAYPSIILPDTLDWLISPKSFASAEPLKIGVAGCE
jgi:hypothetical protein